MPSLQEYLPPASRFEPDDRRMSEAVLYLAARSASDPRFGATKLNKLLFYSDFGLFAQRGRPLTGFEYMKLEHGPAPRGLPRLIDDLVRQGFAAIEQRNRGGKVQKRLVALRDADLSAFTAEEIAFVDQVLSAFASFDATAISQYSHLFVGWQVAELNETIPYGTALIRREPLSDAQVMHGKELAEAWRRGELA